jgi:S-adenosylmethionine synthetase
MYGFAKNETKEFLPRGVVYVHKLAKRLEEARRKKQIKWLKPDGKTQITFEDGKLTKVLVSTQHEKGVHQEDLRKAVTEKIIKPVLDLSAPRRARQAGGLKGVEVLVNPTGVFELGGFEADTGLTGRKIMVDTYGGLICHGGGCFSGKDLTKVDRSAAYMARFAAKNIVANGYAKDCLVSVAYAIGHVDPLMVHAIDEKGRSLASLVKKHFDFRPLAIIERLNLRRPPPGGGYLQTATYGHFGKKGLPWEEVIRL